MYRRRVLAGVVIISSLVGATALLLLLAATDDAAMSGRLDGERIRLGTLVEDVPLPPPAPRPGTGELLIAGRVVDANGAPVPGVRVELARVPHWSARPIHAMDDPGNALREGAVSHEEAVASTRSDGQGRFRFRRLPPAHFVVRGVLDASRTCSALLVDTREPSALDVQLACGRGWPLALRIDARTREMPETVYLESDAHEWRRGPLPVPASGEVHLDAVPEGPLRAVLRRAGHMTLVHEFVPDASVPTTLAFPHPDGVDIRVDVTNDQGQLISGAMVWVTTGHQHGSGVRCVAQATTDDRGTAHITGLPAQHLVRLQARADGFASGVINLASRAHPLSPAVETHVGVRLRPGALVAGVVVDPAGRGIAGARVTLDPRDGPIALTGPEGGVLLRGVEPGRRSVHVTHPGYRQLQSEALGWSARGQVIPKTGGSVRLVMARAASVKGTVVDREGDPVANALVRVDLPHGPATLTRADGRFRLEGVPCGRAIQLTAHTIGGAQHARSEGILVGPGTIHHLEPLVVERTNELRGRLVSRSGEPVRGVRVGVRAPMETEATTRSDEQGFFVFRGLQAGTYTVRVWEAEASWQHPVPIERAEVRIDAGVETRTLEIRTRRRSRIRGRVTDDSGAPLAGLRVEVRGMYPGPVASDLRPASRDPDRSAATYTDGAGRFEIGDLWGGDGLHELSVEGRRVPRGLAAGDQEHVIVAPHARARRVRLELVDRSRKPFEPATVSLHYMGAAGQNSGPESVLDTETITVLSGVAMLRVPRACVSIRCRLEQVEGRSGWAYNEQVVPVADVVRVTFPRWVRMPEHSFRVRVLDEGGEPTANALVEVAQPDTHFTPAWEQGRFRIQATALTDEQGLARFEGLPFERVRVRVGRTHLQQRSEIKTAHADKECVLIATPGRQVRGRVVNASGVGVARVEVGVWSRDRPDELQRVLSDEDGRFLLLGLPDAGQVSVEFHPPREMEPCYLPASLDDVDPTDPRELSVGLRRGYLIRGRLRMRDGSPLEIAHFSIQPLGSAFVRASRALALDSRDGGLVGGPVPEGRYRLLFHGSLQRMGAYMEEAIEVEVPGPAFDGVASPTWHLRVRTEGPVLDRNELEIGWYPDETIVTAAERAASGDHSARLFRTARLAPRDETATIVHVREQRGWVYAVELGESDRYALHRVTRELVEPLRLILKEGHKIAGRVDGTGVHRLRLRQGALVINTTTTHSGEFFVGALPPGEWTIELLSPSSSYPEQVLATTTADAGDTNVKIE